MRAPSLIVLVLDSFGLTQRVFPLRDAIQVRIKPLDGFFLAIPGARPRMGAPANGRKIRIAAKRRKKRKKKTENKLVFSYQGFAANVALLRVRRRTLLP